MVKDGEGRGKPGGIARQNCDWLSRVTTGRGGPDLLGEELSKVEVDIAERWPGVGMAEQRA